MSYPINNFTIEAIEFYTPKHITDKSKFNALINRYIKRIISDHTDSNTSFIFEYSIELDDILNDLCTNKSKTLHIRLFDDNSTHYETIIITGYIYRDESITLDKNEFTTDRELVLRVKHNYLSRVRITD